MYVHPALDPDWKWPNGFSDKKKSEVAQKVKNWLNTQGKGSDLFEYQVTFVSFSIICQGGADLALFDVYRNENDISYTMKGTNNKERIQFLKNNKVTTSVVSDAV